MKKRICFLFSLGFSIHVMGQQNVSYTGGFGLTLGPEFSAYTARTPGNRITSNLRLSMEAGIYTDFPVGPDLYLQPTLCYAGKGGRDITSGDILSLSYLELPMDFVIKPYLGGDNRLWAGFGPYVAYGIGGSTGSSLKTDPFKSNAGGAGSFDRFDAGAHFQLGYQSPFNLLVGLNGELGFSNILHGGNGSNADRNVSFSLFAGFEFGSIK